MSFRHGQHEKYRLQSLTTGGVHAQSWSVGLKRSGSHPQISDADLISSASNDFPSPVVGTGSLLRSSSHQNLCGQANNVHSQDDKRRLQTMTRVGVNAQTWSPGLKRSGSHEKIVNTDSEDATARRTQGGVKNAASRPQGIAASFFAFLRNIRGREEKGPIVKRSFSAELDLLLMSRAAPSPGPSFFLDLMTDQVKIQCFQHMQMCTYQCGEAIVRLGEVGDKLFVLESGSVEASLHGKTLQTLQQGNFFGEISFLAAAWQRLHPPLSSASSASSAASTASTMTSDQLVPPVQDHTLQYRQCDVIALQDNTECWELSVQDFVAIVKQHRADLDEVFSALRQASEDRLARIREAQTKLQQREKDSSQGYTRNSCDGRYVHGPHIRPVRQVSHILSLCLVRQLANHDET